MTQLLRTRTAQTAVRVRREVEDEQPPPPIPPSGATQEVARQLANTARETRAARYKSFVSVTILTVVAVGAVIAGVAADSGAFWAGASVVFYTALVAIIAFAANELGVVSKTADLLRAALKGDAPVQGEPEERTEVTREEVAYEIGQHLEGEGQMDAAEYAYRLASKTGHAEALYAVGRLLDARGDFQNADRYLLLAAGAGHFSAAQQLGLLHASQDNAVPILWNSWIAVDDNVVAWYVLGREEGDVSSLDSRVRLFIAEEGYELDWGDTWDVVRQLAQGHPDEADERLAFKIWRELKSDSSQAIVLDNDDLVVLDHSLRQLQPDADSQLSSLRTAVDEALDKIRARERDESE